MVHPPSGARLLGVPEQDPPLHSTQTGFALDTCLPPRCAGKLQERQDWLSCIRAARRLLRGATVLGRAKRTFNYVAAAAQEVN